jgi:hypothetical protein
MNLSRTRARNAALSVLGAATCAVLLAACVNSPLKRAPNSSIGVKNIAQWRLPLDPYIESENRNAAYARELLMQPCMEARGISFKVGFREVRPDGDDTFNSAGRRIFSVDIASKHGYRIVEEPETEIDRDWTEAESEAYTDCSEPASSQFLAKEPPSDLGLQLAGDAYNATLKDSAVRAAAEKWAICMKPQGFSDLGSDPASMPSPSLSDRFGLNEDGYKTPHSSPEEIALAVADATCQESSGYLKAFYDAEWERQLELLSENADALAPIKKQLDEERRRIREVIAQNPVSR